MPSSENLEQQFPDLVSVFQLDNLTGDQIQALLKIGIRTVADLAGADLFLNPVLKEDNMHAQIKQILGEEYKLPRLEFIYDEQEINAQEALRDNKLAFPEVLRSALETILTDDNDMESPRRLVIEVYELFPDKVDNAEAQIEAKLREHLEHGKLRLLPNIDWSDMEKDYGFYPPENGETAAGNWVFSLSLSQLSDHLYWVIIDRQGEEEPYVYGFN